VRLFLLLVMILPILVSCKKDKLENGFEILQGKWVYIGSREARVNKVTGDKTYTFIPSEFPDSYALEFERRGIVSLWENESEVKKYRLETTLFKEGCNTVQNCRQLGMNLNFNIDKQINVFMNEDTMYTGDKHLNVPLYDYSDNVAEYLYLHIYVRIN